MPRKWSLFRVWVGGVPLEARSHARHLGRGHLWAAAHRFGRLGSSFAPKFGIPRICKVVTGWRLPGWLPLSAAPAATLAAAAATLAADFHPPAATPRRPGSHLAGSRQPPRPPWLPGGCRGSQGGRGGSHPGCRGSHLAAKWLPISAAGSQVAAVLATWLG